jgi:transcription antitermination factor NusG
MLMEIMQDQISNEPAADRAVRWLNSAFPQWFAILVKPRFEKAVASTLASKGYETLVPLYKKVHNYRHRSRNFELPLFPGYVCCHFDVRTRLPILMTPGVVGVVGTRTTPIPLSDSEVESLQRAIKAQVPVLPFPFVDEGRKVRINSGVLAGVEGIVLRSKPSLRLVLSISLLQRSVVLEIGREQVSAERDPDLVDVVS